MGGDSDSPEFPYMLETKTIGVDPYQAPDRQDLILSAGALSMALLSSQWSKMRCTRASGGNYDMKNSSRRGYIQSWCLSWTVVGQTNTHYPPWEKAYTPHEKWLTRGQGSVQQCLQWEEVWGLVWNRPWCYGLSVILTQRASKSHTYFVMSRLQFCASHKSLNWPQQASYNVVLNTSPLRSSMRRNVEWQE